LRDIVIKPLIDVQYGGENGFSQVARACVWSDVWHALCDVRVRVCVQAIELAADALSNVKLVQACVCCAALCASAHARVSQEKRLITAFFDEIAKDTGTAPRVVRHTR
jgi:peptide subunit release factor 1 (eRF1)